MTDEVRSSAARPVVFGCYLALVMGIGPLLHYSLSAMGPLVVDELGLSATAFGTLWFVTFGAAALFSVSGGTITDAFGPKRLITGLFCGVILAILLAAVAASYWWLVAAVAVSGVAQSASNPVTNALVSQRIRPASQALVLGIKQSGVQTAQLLSGLTLPTVALVFGWRAALLTGVIVAGIGLIGTARLIPNDNERTQRRGGPQQTGMSGHVRRMTCYSFVMGGVVQATNVYLPLYAHQELGASVTRAGLVVAVLGGVAIVARLAWAIVVRDSAGLYGPLTLLAALACLSITAFWVSDIVGEWLLWFGAGLFSISALVANTLIMLAVVRSVGPGTVGRASGRAALGMYFGFMLGPLLFGLLVDASSYRVAWGCALAITTSLLLTSAFWWHQQAQSRATGHPPETDAP